MNPLTNTKNQNLMNERELRLGYTGQVSSWHRQYKDSAWIFIGGLNYELTEGDIVCAFSQYGEVANINLVRDRDTGKSKGFAFLCYENQKSTILATDNLNGIKLGGRIIRVDHVEKYKVPNVGIVKVGKENPDQMPPSDNVSDFVRQHGCGPEAMQHILKIQKAKKPARAEQASSEQRHRSRSRSPGQDHGRRRRSPSLSPPRGAGGRVPSVSPPRGTGRRVPPVSPPRGAGRRVPSVSPPRGVGRREPSVSPPRKTRRFSRSPARQNHRPISRAYSPPLRRQDSPRRPERFAVSPRPRRSPPVSPPGRRLQASSTSGSRDLENSRLPSPPRRPSSPLPARQERDPFESSPGRSRGSRPSPVSSPTRKRRQSSVSPPRKARLPSASPPEKGNIAPESLSRRRQRSPSVSPPRKTRLPSVSPPRRRR